MVSPKRYVLSENSVCIMFTVRSKTLRNELVCVKSIYIEKKCFYIFVQGAETAEFVSFLNTLELLLTKQR